MPELLQFTIDKFTFRIAADRHYTSEGIWVKEEGSLVRLGLSDFLQQRSGDAAFIEIEPSGTRLTNGDEFATLETIKVNIGLSSPVDGSISEVNPEMEISPELVNLDPYGSGWLVLVGADNWEADRTRLLNSAAYFELVKQQAEDEV